MDGKLWQMNSQIKELCERAKVYATECTKHFTGDEPVVWMDYYTEKFAQLIVAECMKLNSKELSITAIERLLPMYREHFGVEE
jgi:hypothetical protein